MSLNDIFRSYFQLLGAMFLTSQTFWMAYSILSGIFIALFTFFWELTTITCCIVFSYATLLLAIWIYVYKSYGNSDLEKMIREYCGDKVILKTFPCFKC